jgi:hypothetical protein
MKKPLIIVILAVFIGGCNNYRFVPSHGGGKRFDEEERAVAAAIRNAVAQMDVGPLSGHKTNIVVTTLGHNGGATVSFPGLTNAAASYSYNSQNYYTAPVVLNNQDSWSASVNYNPTLNAVPTVFGTDQDVAYLDAALQLRLRVNGVLVAVPDPEYVLYVLVDVLGTNRSKEDSIVAWQDMLTASCELTYYIVDTKTNKIISEAKRASAEASYREASVLGFAGYEGERVQYKTAPNPMPTDINDPVILFNKTVVFHTGKPPRYPSEPPQETAPASSPSPEPNAPAKPAPVSAIAPSEPNAAPKSALAPSSAQASEPNIAPKPTPVLAPIPEPNTAQPAKPTAKVP